jgi:hypothetical protein
MRHIHRQGWRPSFRTYTRCCDSRHRPSSRRTRAIASAAGRIRAWPTQGIMRRRTGSHSPALLREGRVVECREIPAQYGAAGVAGAAHKVTANSVSSLFNAPGRHCTDQPAATAGAIAEMARDATWRSWPLVSRRQTRRLAIALVVSRVSSFTPIARPSIGPPCLAQYSMV